MTDDPFDRLIRLYPRRFRERYGSELRTFLADDLERSRRRGGAFWRARFRVRAYRDAVVASLRLRITAWGDVGVGSRATRGVVAEAADDMTYAIRGFGRQPGFHALVLVTVALGVAAVTASFSVLDGVVRKPLPYPEPGRLVEVGSAMRQDPESRGPMSQPLVLAVRDGSRTLEEVVALEARSRVLLGEGEPRRVEVTAGSEGVFRVLGARAAAGRLFVDADHERGMAVAVLSYEAWSGWYGGSRDAVGRTLELDGVIHEIVGVVDRDFVAPEPVAGTPEIWTALWLNPDASNAFGSVAIGRLASGVGEGMAEAEVGELLRRAGDGAESWPLVGAHVRDLRTAIVGSVGATLWLFLGAVALLLAIACTNVANLMLARGLDRAGEVSIRRALGASRGRLVRQLLTESMVTALAGGAAGVLLAWALVAGFVALAPGGIPRLAEVSVDGRVLVFALAVSCATGVLFGIAPALNATRPESGNRTTAARGASRLRGALVVIETAIAVVLVLASGLLMNSFVRMRTVNPGFEADGLVVMQVELRAGYDDRSSWSPFWNTLLERVESLPGVESAALSAFTPFIGFPMAQAYSPEDAGLDPQESAFLPSVPVSAGWDRTFGLDLLEGRAFDGTEQSESEPVVMVNRAFADRYWPGETAITGRRIRSGALAAPGGTWYRVVGVTSDMRHRLGREPTPTVYHPHTQHLWRTMSVLARVQGDPAPVIAGLRNTVRSIDDALPIQRIGAVGTLASESVTEPRFYSTLSAGFGAIALILALVGIHGTSAWTTARRSREIGIRLTLGARPHDVRTMLTLKALWLALAGVTLGIAVALTGTGWIEDYLYDLSPTDPTTVIATVVIMVGTAMTAAWLPARRASRADPAATLRSDA